MWLLLELEKDERDIENGVSTLKREYCKGLGNVDATHLKESFVKDWEMSTLLI